MLLVIVAGFVGLAAWVGGDTSRGETPPPGTAQQIAAAQDMLTCLPGVAGAEVDPYDSSCGIGRSWCLVSTTLTRDQLTAEALDVLKERGASLGRHGCQPIADVPECTAELGYRGTRLQLFSDTPWSASFGGSSDGRRTLSVAVQTPGRATTVATPLGAWSDVDPLPATWPVHATCDSPQPLSRGCIRYDFDPPGLQTFAGTLKHTTDEALASLKAHGYGASSERCGSVQGTQHCSITGRKFRQLGGRAGITAMVSVEAELPTTVSVTVTLEATAD